MGDVVAIYSAIMRMNAARRTAAATERRRRRYQVRRLANGRGEGAGVGDGEAGLPVVGYPMVVEGIPMAAPGVGRAEGVRVGIQAEPVAVDGENPVPMVGAVAMVGRMRHMEDAIRIKSKLCSPAINSFLPVHYFAVFDGHGGPHFSTMCKEKMHGILEEELMGIHMQQHHTRQHSHPAPVMIADETLLQETWRRVMCRCFERTEAMALETCHCGSVGFHCSCGRSAADFAGTTAVTVVLTQKHIVVANCGDSRAVLFRGGRIIPLTFDHKPDRRDEVARIAASGGYIVGVDTARVQGILAMTRAIGDTYLKPYIISEPEVTFTRRDEEDEFIIVASDGLWDVVSTQMACEVTQDCLQEARDNVGIHINFPGIHGGPGLGPQGNGQGPGLVGPSRSTSAAALLSLLAVTRHSQDNISVIVIDLKMVADENQDDDSLSNIEF